MTRAARAWRWASRCVARAAAGCSPGRGLVNYDTLYTLVWGRDLAGGELPDYDVSLAPTPHPLATLAAALLAPLSICAADGDPRRGGDWPSTTVLAFVALALLGWRRLRARRRLVQPGGRSPGRRRSC